MDEYSLYSLRLWLSVTISTHGNSIGSLRCFPRLKRMPFPRGVEPDAMTIFLLATTLQQSDVGSYFALLHLTSCDTAFSLCL